MLLGTFEVLRSSAALYREILMDESDVTIFIITVSYTHLTLPTIA